MQVGRSLLVLGWALGCAPVTGWAVDPAWKLRSELARELIAVTKVDQQAAQKVEKLILARCQVERCDADLRECLMKIDKDYFTLFLESDFRNELTAEETRQAIAYFRTVLTNSANRWIGGKAREAFWRCQPAR